MKKTTLLLSGLLTIAGVTAIAGQSQAAVADGGQSGTSKVTATLTSPTDPADKTVKLTAVPDVTFPTTEITNSFLNMVQDNSGNVSVSDSRGTGAGYTVGVKLSTPFAATDDASHKLTGSVLTLNNVGGTSADDTTKTNAGQAAIANDAGNTIVTAKPTEGLGNWNYNIAKSTLDVPAGAYAGAYVGELTWTLTATPEAGA